MNQDENARVRRRAIIACALAAALTPFALYGAFQALTNMRNDVLQWTSSNLEAKKTFDWFGEHFEGQEIIFVSWPGCTIHDPRLARFAELLREEIPRTRGENQLPLIESVTTGGDVWRELRAPPANFSPQHTFAKLRGVMIGPDGETKGGAVVVLSKEGTTKGQEAINRILAVASNTDGLNADEIKLAGYSVQMAAVDKASLSTLYQMAVPAGFAVMFVAWFFLRNIPLTLSVGLIAAFCQAISLAMVYYLGEPMSGMLVIMPVLIIVIFVSGAVHLINYYNDAVHESGPQSAAGHGTSSWWLSLLSGGGDQRPGDRVAVGQRYRTRTRLWLDDRSGTDHHRSRTAHAVSRNAPRHFGSRALRPAPFDRLTKAPNRRPSGRGWPI